MLAQERFKMPREEASGWVISSGGVAARSSVVSSGFSIAGLKELKGAECVATHNSFRRNGV